MNNLIKPNPVKILLATLMALSLYVITYFIFSYLSEKVFTSTGISLNLFSFYLLPLISVIFIALLEPKCPLILNITSNLVAFLALHAITARLDNYGIITEVGLTLAAYFLMLLTSFYLVQFAYTHINKNK